MVVVATSDGRGCNAMPADRLLTINVMAEGAYVDGIWTPGSVTAIRVYGTRRDKSAQDVVEEGGVRGEVRRDWRVRWDSRIATVPVERLEVVEDGGLTFNVLNMTEVTQQRRGQPLRRRFLDLQGVYTT